MGVPGRAVWAGPLRLLLLAGTGQGAECSGVWSDLSWSHCGPRAEAQGEFLLALTRTPQDRGQHPHPRFSVIQGERASSSSPPPRPAPQPPAEPATGEPSGSLIPPDWPSASAESGPAQSPR